MASTAIQRCGVLCDTCRAESKVMRDVPSSLPRLVLVDRASLTSAVVPAVGAHAVRRLGLVAMRAFAEADGLQRVVRAPFRGAGLGVASFRIGHGVSLSKR